MQTPTQTPTQTPNTLTIDGVTYEVSIFSEAIRSAVGVYNAVNADLVKAQYEVVKNQSALQSIGAQIADAVKRELAEQAASAANDEPMTEAAEVAPA